MTQDLKNVVRSGWEQIVQDEDYVDGANLTPGMLVEETADGFQPHSSAAGVVDLVTVAKDMRGRGYEVDPEVTYEDGDFITFLQCNGGVNLTMILDTDEDLSTAYPGGETRLVSAGNGRVRQFDGAGGDDPDAVVGTIQEAADATGEANGLPVDVEVTR